MGQSLSLCGSRSRPARSPSSLSSPSLLAASSPSFAPLSAYDPSTCLTSKLAACESKDNEDGLTSLFPTHLPTSPPDSDDDDSSPSQPLAYPTQPIHPTTSHPSKQRAHRPPPPPHLTTQLASFPSESSLDTSPAYFSDAAYYTTDDDSPLSSSSSISAQPSPDRLLVAPPATSHSIQVVARPSSAQSGPVVSVPLLLPHPPSSPHQRSLTLSASSTCLSRPGAVRLSTVSGFHHSYSSHSLASTQSRHPVALFPSSSSSSLARHGPGSVSTVSMDMSTPSPPPHPSCISVAGDSKPVITRNAVITIRPSVSTTSLSSLATTTTTRTYRSHRKPLSLSPPSPHVHTAPVEDDSPVPTSSRSLFTPHYHPTSGQPTSPASHPGTVLSLMRSL